MPQTVDSFEDGDISEYGGDTGGIATVQSNTVFSGNNALKLVGTPQSSIADGDSFSIAQGETPFGGYVRVASGDSAFVGFGFGIQSDAKLQNNDGYVVRANIGNGSLDFVRYDNGSSTEIASTSLSASAGVWYRVVVSTWDSNGNITAELRDTSGTTLASLSVTDTNYTSGGIAWSIESSSVIENSTGFFDLAQKPAPLSAATSVSTSVSGDDVTISWDAADGASEYDVLRAQSSGTTASDYTTIATVTDDGSASFSVTDTALEDGEKFYYRVESVS